MATIEQKEELAQTLKFTPTTYNLVIQGYGGEIAVAKINKAQYDYWKPKIDENGDSELVEHCVAFDDEDANDVPKEARIVEDGAWYDTEGHIDGGSGAEFNGSNLIEIYDENVDVVFSKDLGYNLEDDGVTIESEECYVGNTEGNDYGFCMQSSEKGTFFDADLPLTAPFDPSKLKIYTTDFEGWELVTGIEYDGEPLEGFDGYDTTGKGYYANVFLT